MRYFYFDEKENRRIHFSLDNPFVAEDLIEFKTNEGYAHGLYSQEIIETAKRIGKGFEWTQGVQVAQVILLPYMTDGTVLYRKKDLWSDTPTEFKRIHASEVIGDLKRGEFNGDFARLEAIFPKSDPLESQSEDAIETPADPPETKKAP